MTTYDEAVQLLIRSIRLNTPAMDTSPTSPVRVLIDAVAELHSQADRAQDKIYDWDITKKQGRDLDQFTELFGINRIGPVHASGFITLTFGVNTTRDYIIRKGTRFFALTRGGVQRVYLASEQVGIPRYSAFATVPVHAEVPGAAGNARPGEITAIELDMEQLVQVINKEAVSGGREPESDEELRRRFQSDLFRDILGTEAWYRSVATRHPNVSGVQLIRPLQDTEEHLKIVDGKAQAQEDSLIYTYPANFSVFNPRTNTWLEEIKDYNVTIDNTTPKPPLITFVSGNYQEGDSVRVRYQYCSNKSRNNPITNIMHYLDIYVTGSNPASSMDYSGWTNENVFGVGSITSQTHPDGLPGLPYYVFARQPVVRVPEEIYVQGRSYFINKDYVLVKDKTLNADSTRAKDILQWKSTLPPGEPFPAFHVPYYHESVVSEIQETLDQPDMHTAIDDVLVHAADRIEFNIDLVVEWEQGIPNEGGIEDSIRAHFASVPMGTRLRIGPLMKAIANVPQVAAVFLDEQGIHSETTIRGKNSWMFDVPLPDGSVPTLNKLNIQTTAPNIYG